MNISTHANVYIYIYKYVYIYICINDSTLYMYKSY